MVFARAAIPTVASYCPPVMFSEFFPAIIYPDWERDAKHEHHTSEKGICTSETHLSDHRWASQWEGKTECES